MDRFIKKTSQFIFSQQKSIFSSAIIISVMIIASSFFGFIRYRVLAGFFIKGQLDIYFASFRIPDLVFEILITGALTSTFIPIYIKYQKNSGELTENISSIINAITLLMIIAILILCVFLDPIITLITPGYSHAKIEQIVFFSRLLLLGQLPFFVLGNFLTGIGQANKTFLLSAIAPIVYNLSIILGTVALAPSLGLLGPIIGVISGAILYFLIQVPLLFQTHFRFAPVIKITNGLREFIRMVVPRAFTVIVAQIDATIDLTLTTFLGSGAYTVFYLAQHLQLLPVSVIGIAMGQASLPYLSEMHQEGRTEEFKKIIVDTMLNVFFLIAPLMSFFVFARTPLIRLFFGGEKFDWSATVQTAVTLSYFAVALPFHSIYYFFTRCYYALLDSRTPFYISAFSIILNTALSLYFVFILHLPVWALAISFSLSMIINSSVLFLILTKRLGNFDFRFLSVEALKITIATGIPAIISYYAMRLLDGLIFDTSRTINVFFLLATIAGLFFVLYLVLSLLLDVKEIYLLTKLFIKAREYQRKFVEIYTNYE